MRSRNAAPRGFFLSLLPLALSVGPVGAQVTAVAVGVTPSCPYGISGCWPGAAEGLARLGGVESVARTPDAYNCTAEVYLKGGGLPDLDRWPQQFKSVVGDSFAFRGVEVTVRGVVESKDGGLVLRVPALDRPLPLAPLRNKLQWNPKKAAARQPEPDEQDAHAQLAARRQGAGAGGFWAEVTGPLRKGNKGLVLEVREFYPRASDAPGR